MMQRILEYIVCLLAIYGLFSLVRGAIGAVHCKVTGKRPVVRAILLVRNAEEHIEYIIRNIVNKEYKSKVLSDKNIIIVDMNSEDLTYVMLEKLQNDFQNINILTYEERLKIFDDI